MAKVKRKRADQKPSKEDPNQKRRRRSAKDKSIDFSYSDDKKCEEEEDWDQEEPDLDENEEAESSEGTSDHDSRSGDGSDHDEHSDREDDVDPTSKGPTLKGADDPNEGLIKINTVEDIEAQIAALKAMQAKMMKPVQNMNVDDNHETDKTKFPSTSGRKQNSELENSKKGKKMKCDMCELQFEEMSSLEDHITNVHLNHRSSAKTDNKKETLMNRRKSPAASGKGKPPLVDQKAKKVKQEDSKPAVVRKIVTVKPQIPVVELDDDSNTRAPPAPPRRKANDRPPGSEAKGRGNNPPPAVASGSKKVSIEIQLVNEPAPSLDPATNALIDNMLIATESDTEATTTKATVETPSDDQVFKTPGDPSAAKAAAKTATKENDQLLRTFYSQNYQDQPSTSRQIIEDKGERTENPPTEKIMADEIANEELNRQDDLNDSTTVAPRKSSDSSQPTDESMGTNSNGHDYTTEMGLNDTDATEDNDCGFTADDDVHEILTAYQDAQVEIRERKQEIQDLTETVEAKNIMIDELEKLLKDRSNPKLRDKIKSLEEMVRTQDQDLMTKIREVQAAEQRARSWADQFECLFGWLKRGTSAFNSMYRLSYTNLETVPIENDQLLRTFYTQIKDSVRDREGQCLKSPGDQICGRGLAQVTSGFFTHWVDKKQFDIEQVADCLFGRCRIKDEEGNYCNKEFPGIVEAVKGKDGRIIAFSPGLRGIKAMDEHQRGHFRSFCPICHRGFNKAQEEKYGTKDPMRPTACPFNSCWYNHLVKTGESPKARDAKCKEYTFYAHVRLNAKGDRRDKGVVRDYERICIACSGATNEAIVARNSVYADAYQMNVYFHGMVSCKNPYCYAHPPNKRCKADFHDADEHDALRLAKAKKWDTTAPEEKKGPKNKGKGKNTKKTT